MYNISIENEISYEMFSIFANSKFTYDVKIIHHTNKTILRALKKFLFNILSFII